MSIGKIMKVEEIFDLYNGSAKKAAKALEMSHLTLYVWRIRKFIPIRAQIKIERLTGGKLKADTQDCSPPGEGI